MVLRTNRRSAWDVGLPSNSYREPHVDSAEGVTLSSHPSNVSKEAQILEEPNSMPSPPADGDEAPGPADKSGAHQSTEEVLVVRREAGADGLSVEKSQSSIAHGAAGMSRWVCGPLRIVTQGWVAPHSKNSGFVARRAARRNRALYVRGGRATSPEAPKGR